MSACKLLLKNTCTNNTQVFPASNIYLVNRGRPFFLIQ